jgi:hypothetical protein
LLGQPVPVGSIVAAVRRGPYKHNMCVSKVIGHTPKMLKLKQVDGVAEWLTYSTETVKLDNEAAAVYILKNAT